MPTHLLTKMATYYDGMSFAAYFNIGKEGNDVIPDYILDTEKAYIESGDPNYFYYNNIDNCYTLDLPSGGGTTYTYSLLINPNIYTTVNDRLYRVDIDIEVFTNTGLNFIYLHVGDTGQYAIIGGSTITTGIHTVFLRAQVTIPGEVEIYLGATKNNIMNDFSFNLKEWRVREFGFEDPSYYETTPYKFETVERSTIWKPKRKKIKK